jgi:hypothetical protein
MSKVKTRVVDIQEDGVIRNEDGYIIARLVDGIDFDSEHLQEKKMVDMEIDMEESEFLYVAQLAHDRDITFNKMIEIILTQFIEEEERNGKSNS